MTDSISSNVRTYRKKPIDVKAYLWDGNINLDLPPGTIYGVYEMSEGHIYGKIRSREGELTIRAGEHYIVGPGAKGEYWPVEREIFEATYEEFSGDSSAPETKGTADVAVFDSAVNCLQEIAAMSRKLGSETAANWLAQHGYPREPGGYIPGRGFAQKTKPEPGPMCSVCDHNEEMHKVMGASHAFTQKASANRECEKSKDGKHDLNASGMCVFCWDRPVQASK